MAVATLQKALGAYYTGIEAANALVRWAIRARTDTVLDPSCGDGIFLESASRYLCSLGGSAVQICGVDLAAEAAGTSSQRVPGARITRSDFFILSPSELGLFDAVVGNPPFIRYQTFSGISRRRALSASERNGVKLSELSSAWAPFVVHACSFIKPGGRLAMVLPSELGHAGYAKDVLTFLLGNFGQVRLALFRRKLFPELSQGTLLCCCDGFGQRAPELSFSIYDSIEDFDRNHQGDGVPSSDINDGFRFQRFLIGRKARSLYDHLSMSSRVSALGDLGSIGIGYVTGANDYFHLTENEVKNFGMQRKFLRPAILSLSGFGGLRFTRLDWQAIRDRGDKCYFLRLTKKSRSSPELRRYLRTGLETGIHQRFKCRVRDPWYAVPHVRIAHVFLSYMSGSTPKLIENQAALVCPNTVHTIVLRRQSRAGACIVGWQTALTELSCELEGHAMGGGMLKLEPSEARRIRIPICEARKRTLNVLEAHARGENMHALRSTADVEIMMGALGATRGECDLLRGAAAELRNWRLGKSE